MSDDNFETPGDKFRGLITALGMKLGAPMNDDPQAVATANELLAQVKDENLSHHIPVKDGLRAMNVIQAGFPLKTPQHAEAKIVQEALFNAQEQSGTISQIDAHGLQKMRAKHNFSFNA